MFLPKTVNKTPNYQLLHDICLSPKINVVSDHQPHSCYLNTDSLFFMPGKVNKRVTCQWNRGVLCVKPFKDTFIPFILSRVYFSSCLTRVFLPSRFLKISAPETLQTNRIKSRSLKPTNTPVKAYLCGGNHHNLLEVIKCHFVTRFSSVTSRRKGMILLPVKPDTVHGFPRVFPRGAP